jgi:hypothetical protein
MKINGLIVIIHVYQMVINGLLLSVNKPAINPFDFFADGQNQVTSLLIQKQTF